MLFEQDLKRARFNEALITTAQFLTERLSFLFEQISQSSFLVVDNQ